MYPIVTYIKFLFKSTNQHGVHSPFIYDLVTNCFYDKTDYIEYEVIQGFRHEIFHNNKVIEVTDLGSGSRVFKSNFRRVRKIAKTAGIGKSRSKLLFRIIQYLNPEYILELGTSLGLSTVAMYLGNPEANIVTLEGCANTLKIAEQQFLNYFRSKAFDNISFINTEFNSYLKTSNFSYLKSNHEKWNLVYFDGNHSKTATLDYVNSLLPTTTDKTLWIFDDIHWSEDMEGAWEAIKNLTEVTVTIDTFQWGLVFFRKEQAKQHFIIRI